MEPVPQRVTTPPLVSPPLGHTDYDTASSESRSSYDYRRGPPPITRSGLPVSQARNDFLNLIASQEKEEGILLYRRLYYLVRRISSLLAIGVLLGIFLAMILLFTVFHLPSVGVKMAFSLTPVFTAVIIFGCIGPQLTPLVLNYFIDRLVRIRLAIENELGEELHNLGRILFTAFVSLRK